MPRSVQRIRFGFSSNASVMLRDGGRAERDRRDDAVLEVERRLAHRRFERQLRSVRRPLRVGVGAFLRDHDLRLAGGWNHHRDVGGAAVSGIAGGAMIVGNAAAVRRPREVADHDVALGQLLRGPGGKIEQMQMRVAMILILELDVAPALLALLDRVGQRIERRERDLLAVGRPREIVDALFASSSASRLRRRRARCDRAGACRHDRR